MLNQRAQGVALPYLLGEWEFYGLPFWVSPAVLIPRPETELLVERALAWLQSHPACTRAVDVGTGSGCIAVTLARKRPQLHVDALDLSFPALQVARRNVGRHQVTDHVCLVQGDLLAPLAGPYRLVCANLPYIPSASLAALPVAANEPRLALDGGRDGLIVIQELLLQARRVTAPGTCLLLEVEYRQGAEAIALAGQIFPQAQIQVHRDLAGLDRLLEVQR
jgi:release factor glutamine methyltransferase